MEETYAVGIYKGFDDVDFDTLKYFEDKEKALNYYQTLFFSTRKLALFTIRNNYIVDIEYYRYCHESSKIGPIGPLKGTAQI